MPMAAYDEYTPVIPLPNPGEGGPVYPGDDMDTDPGGTPARADRSIRGRTTQTTRPFPSTRPRPTARPAGGEFAFSMPPTATGRSGLP